MPRYYQWVPGPSHFYMYRPGHCKKCGRVTTDVGKSYRHSTHVKNRISKTKAIVALLNGGKMPGGDLSPEGRD